MVRQLYKAVLAIALSFPSFIYGATIDTMTGVFDNRVKTLSLRNPDSFMSPPVINLSSGSRLALNFDIVGDSHEYLRYRLVHCNADWLPSRLLEPEYVGGFNETEVSDYAYSSNTYVHYVNYNIELPGEEMKFLASGNYLLQVYPEGNPEQVILQQRFYVSEDSVRVSGGASGRTDVGLNTEYQQLDFTLSTMLPQSANLYQDVVVTVTQNNRPETTRTIAHPLRVEGDKIVYSHLPDLIFRAGNEYRRFETVRADYAGMHADSVKFGGSNWHSWLTPDESRVDKDYTYDSTQHGRFKIDEYSTDDPDLGADYVTVHFTLDIPELTGGEVYVDGDFSFHRFGRFNKMVYDRGKGAYVAEIPLKQGSYNYQYVVASPEGNVDPSPIEGDKYETRNEYLVCVYYRAPGSRGDRLIGTAVIIPGQG